MNSPRWLFLLLMITCGMAGSSWTMADTPCWVTTPEQCIEGPSSKVINGITVTRACWTYRTKYTCGILPQVDNCSTIRNTAGCTLSNSVCSSTDQAGNCTLNQYTYACTAAGAATSQTVCGSDVYCGNGDCVGTAQQGPSSFSNGYGSAAAFAAAVGSFDPNTATVLKGYSDACRKQLNGALDCCNFSGILNGVLSCNTQEQDLANADQQKRDHYVGKYCSSSVLGVCVEDTHVYCVFQSLLARIVQEQGRVQLGMGWGTPQAPQCQGLTLAQFQSIDFSKIDFSEYIATVSLPSPNSGSSASTVQTNAQATTLP